MKRIAALGISVAILVLIFTRIDTHKFFYYLRNIDPLLFSLSILMFVPQFLVMARRWQLIIEESCRISLWNALWLLLAGNTLNMVLPSKLGDFAKTLYHRNNNGIELKKGIFLTIIEKCLDIGSVSLVLLGGAIFIRNKDHAVSLSIALSAAIVIAVILLFTIDIRMLGLERLIPNTRLREKATDFLNKWEEALQSQKASSAKMIKLAALSIFLWCLHIGQIYLFFLALGSTVSPAVVFALAPVSILIGLIPVSFGGIGTRDAALIYLFAPYEKAPLMASVGVLCTLRYLVPALVGLPFIPRLGFKPSEVANKKGAEMDFVA